MSLAVNVHQLHLKVRDSLKICNIPFERLSEHRKTNALYHGELRTQDEASYPLSEIRNSLQPKLAPQILNPKAFKSFQKLQQHRNKNIQARNPKAIITSSDTTHELALHHKTYFTAQEGR